MATYSTFVYVKKNLNHFAILSLEGTILVSNEQYICDSEAWQC